MKRNDPCPCGSGKKYKKCCLKWHNMGWPSPPRNGLPNDPKPCGQSLGIIGGGPKNVPMKERFLAEKSGNYRQYWEKMYHDANGIERVKVVKSWYSVYRKGELDV